MSDLDVGSASPPTADVPTEDRDAEFAELQAAVAALSADVGTSRLDVPCPLCDAPAGQRCHYPASGTHRARLVLAARSRLDHSGVAGEPEATTKEASEIDSPVPPTQLPVPTPDGPAAADVAGGVVVTVEAVRAYIRGACGPDAVLSEGGPFWREIATGLDAAAPLIVEHYLRQQIRAAEPVPDDARLWEHIAEMAKASALRTAMADVLRPFHSRLRDHLDIYRGARVLREGVGAVADDIAKLLDELERGTAEAPPIIATDRGPCEVCGGREATGDPSMCAGCRARFNAWRAERGADRG